MNDSQWMVQVPINDLMQLMQMKDTFDTMKQENAQLRREMEGLRRIQSEQMEVIGDLRRACRSLA